MKDQTVGALAIFALVVVFYSLIHIPSCLDPAGPNPQAVAVAP